MNHAIKPSRQPVIATAAAATPRSRARRRFILTSSASAGGLMLGLHVPMALGQGVAGGAEPGARPRLGQFFHRPQPRHPRVA